MENLSKEKQIEEMRKDLIEIFNEEYEKRRLLTPDFTAEKMTAKGYRKQSEGEWIKHFASYECTVCKQEFCVSEYAEDYDPIEDYDLHFCPNCGAKMKGE